MPIHLPSRTRTLLRLGAAAAVAASLTAAAPAGADGQRGLTLSGTEGQNGWYTSDVVRGEASWDVEHPVVPHISGDRDEAVSSADCLGPMVDSPHFSGLAAASPFIQPFTVTGPTDHDGTEVVCNATFQQNLWHCVFGVCWEDPYTLLGTSSQSTRVKIDPSPPFGVVGTPQDRPAALDWHKTPTSVNFSGSDTPSGIQSCSRDVAVRGPSSTSVKVAPGSCTNVAGLVTHGSYAYRFDDTLPELAPTVSAERVVQGSDLTASPNASDAHSGVASASCEQPDTSTVGTHTVRCTATDVATNSASAEATYEVVPAPANAPGGDDTPKPDPTGPTDDSGQSADGGQTGPQQQPQQQEEQGVPAPTLTGSLGAIKGNTIKRSQLKKGYPLQVTCSADSNAAAKLTVPSSMARKLKLRVANGQRTVTIGSASTQCKATGGGKLTLKLARTAKSKVLQSKRTLGATLGLEYTKPGSEPFKTSRSLELT